MTDSNGKTEAPELEELDVEAYAKEHVGSDDKPLARFYVVRIDRERKRVRESTLTGRRILALVSKNPESHKLFQKFRDGRTEVVEPDHLVSFRAPGVERFQTIPKDTTEGAE